MSANQIAAQQAGNNAGSYLSPAYDIQSSYSQNVDNWIATYSQNLKSPTFFTFSTSDSSNESWEKLGFKETSVQVDGSYCIFFRATYQQNGKTVTREVSAAEAGSSLSVKVTCTGLGTYTVNPGQKW